MAVSTMTNLSRTFQAGSWTLSNVARELVQPFMRGKAVAVILKQGGSPAGMVLWFFLLPYLAKRAEELAVVEPFLARHISTIQTQATRLGRLSLALSLANMFIDNMRVQSSAEPTSIPDFFAQMQKHKEQAEALPKTTFGIISNYVFIGAACVFTASYFTLKFIEMRVNKPLAIFNLSVFSISCLSTLLPGRHTNLIERGLGISFTFLAIYTAKSMTMRLLGLTALNVQILLLMKPNLIASITQRLNPLAENAPLNPEQLFGPSVQGFAPGLGDPLPNEEEG